MGRDGMGWDGMGWDGMGWDGMGALPRGWGPQDSPGSQPPREPGGELWVRLCTAVGILQFLLPEILQEYVVLLRG